MKAMLAPRCEIKRAEAERRDNGGVKKTNERGEEGFCTPSAGGAMFWFADGRAAERQIFIPVVFDKPKRSDGFRG